MEHSGEREKGAEIGFVGNWELNGCENLFIKIVLQMEREDVRVMKLP